MTDAELELDSVTLYLEALVADLRDMLNALPRDEFASEQNRRTFLRLRGAAIDVTSMYLAASTLAETKEQPNAVE